MSESVQVIQIKAETKISNKFTEIRAVKVELRDLRKQYRSALDQDKEYHDRSVDLKAGKMALKTIQDRLDKVPAVATLIEKIGDLKGNLKSEQLTLSDWLINYKEITGNTTIPDDKGDIVKIEIKKVVRIVKT